MEQTFFSFFFYIFYVVLHSSAIPKKSFMNAFLIQETGLILYSSSTKGTVYLTLNQIWFACSIHENDLLDFKINLGTKWNESENQINFHEHLRFMNICLSNLFKLAIPYARHYKPRLVFFLLIFHWGCGLYYRQFMY